MCVIMICSSFIYVGIQIKNTNVPELTKKLDNIKNLNYQLTILNKSILKIDDLYAQLKSINESFSKLDIEKISNQLNEIIKIFTKPIKFDSESGVIIQNKP